ncbi:MAG TPA: hypothetical protein VIJ20_00015 [Solirubrobacteraceae bacterium]
MSSRRLAAVAVLATLGALALPATALAHTRLAGAFAMTGRITAARGVMGEHVGEAVSRTWVFGAPCPAGQCLIESLVRSQATGQDRVTLRRPGILVLDRWVGMGSFFAPLRCGSRVYPRGERVFFTIRVRITVVAVLGGAPAATGISASYTSYRRTNRTRCVPDLGRDAAVYTGTLITPTPPAPTPAPG